MADDVRKLFRVPHVARRLKVPRQTLKSAIERGEIPTIETGCGLTLVLLADVRRWLRNRPPLGRPPGS